MALRVLAFFVLLIPACAVADFLAAQLEAAVTRNKELWEFLVPFTLPVRAVTSLLSHSNFSCSAFQRFSAIAFMEQFIRSAVAIHRFQQPFLRRDGFSG
jgi:hypothetical protein